MGKLAESRVSLRITGETLDPAEITRALGAQPTLGVRKGEARASEFVERAGMWILKSGVARPGDLDRQIRELFERVSADEAVWTRLTQTHTCDVFAGLFMGTGNDGLSLQPETLTMLATRGLALHFDIYDATDEGDTPERDLDRA